jgi:glycosyltransferase involved in cell wall biosynthesis
MRLVYLADAPYVHTQRWVDHSVQSGWDTHVVSFRPAEIEGAQVHHIEGMESVGRLRYLATAGRIKRLVSELQPDILHALHLTSYGFLAALCETHPRLASVWGTDILQAPGWSPFHSAITRYALARADHVTATGFRLASATLRFAPRGKPVTVIPYGVDTERFRPSEDRRPSGPVVIGSVGRLSIEKGLPDLLRAAAQLLERRVNLRIVLAGDGPERQRLETLARELHIEASLELRGQVAHENVPGVLREIDIFAMPSRAEGFGVAALEASAAGIPIVASRVHGIPDVVRHGETGLLVPPRNVASLAAALDHLVGDAALRDRMGRAGRAFVEQRYRWEANCRQMDRLYAEVLTSFTTPERYGTVATGSFNP